MSSFNLTFFSFHNLPRSRNCSVNNRQFLQNGLHIPDASRILHARSSASHLLPHHMSEDKSRHSGLHRSPHVIHLRHDHDNGPSRHNRPVHHIGRNHLQLLLLHLHDRPVPHHRSPAPTGNDVSPLRHALSCHAARRLCATCHLFDMQLARCLLGHS